MKNPYYVFTYLSGYVIILIVKLSINIYIFCTWGRKKILDPTLIHSKVSFYQFLTVGTVEFIWLILGIVLISTKKLGIDEIREEMEELSE